MRKTDLNAPLSQFGCITKDRRVGPWVLMRDNAWHAPVWIRKGPDGYRNLFNDEVTFVSLAGFSAYAPDGLTEASGHVWGNNNRVIDNDENIEDLKRRMDRDLIDFGWIVDDSMYVAPAKTVWQRFREWLRW